MPTTCRYRQTPPSKVADRMIRMAKGLERDPQVESILRNRVFRPCLSEALGRALPIWLGEGEAEESASGCERGPLRAPISDVRSDTALSRSEEHTSELQSLMRTS